MWQISGLYTSTGIIPKPPYSTETFANLLLSGETDGFAIDATPENGTVSVKDTSTPANNLSNVILDSSNLVQSGTSPKLVLWNSDPYLRWTPHNLFVNSGSPATQDVTLVTGFVYTYGVTGGGSITGSSGASGVATSGNPVTFTATGTTGTFTMAGGETTIQINRGPRLTPYLATSGSVRIGLPQEYDTAASKFGILVEPAATNLIAGISDTSWVKQNLLSTSATTDPTGGSDANNWIPDTTNGIHGSPKAVSTTGTATCSVIAKSTGYNYLAIRVLDATETEYISKLFSLIDGTVVDTQQSASPPSVTTSSVDIGGGWWRLILTSTTDLGDITLYIGDSATPSYSAGRPTFAGDGSSGVALYCAQVEAGPIATSPIPTLGSTVTRAADNVTALTSTFNYGSANTMYVRAKAREVATQHDVLAFDANNSNEDESVFLYTDTSANILMRIEDGGSAQLAPLDSTVNATADTEFQVTGAWATNDVDVSADGTAAQSDGTATMPTVDRMRIGCNPTPGNHLNGFIYKIVHVPRHVETDGNNLETWKYNA